MAYPVGGTAPAEISGPSPSNQITSLGAPAAMPEQQPNPQANKAEELITTFGQIFQQYQTLAGSYPGAAAEFNLVIESLKKWLAKASDSIASEGGGNSPTY